MFSHISTAKMLRARLLLLAAPLALGAPTPGPRPPPALDPWSTALAAEAAPKPSSSVAAEVAAAAKEAGCLPCTSASLAALPAPRVSVQVNSSQ